MDTERTPLEAVLEALSVIERDNQRLVWEAKNAMQVAWSAMSVARREHRRVVRLREQAQMAGNAYSRAYVAHQESLRILIAARAAAQCPALPAGVNLPTVEG